MRKLLPMVVILCSVLWSCSTSNDAQLDAASLNYPNNKKSKTDKVYIYDKTILDPYRWLENVTSNEVLDWAKNQNDLSFKYLSSISQREKLSEEVQKLLDLETVYKGSRDGRWYIIEKTEGSSGRQLIHLYENGSDSADIILEPQLIGNSRHVVFGAYCISPDGKLMVFSLKNINTSVEHVYILNLKSKKYVDRPFLVAPNTSLSWGPHGGFYYNKPFTTDNKIFISNALFYHKAGTSSVHDIVVYYDEYTPDIYPTAFRTSDNRYLVVTASNKEQTKMYYKPLVPEDGSKMEKMVELLGYQASIVDNIGDEFLVLTNFDAPNGRVVKINPRAVDSGSWQDVISESDDIKERVYPIGNKFYARGRFGADAVISAFDSSGQLKKRILMKGSGILEGPSGRPNYKDVLFSFRGFSQPSTVYKLTPQTDQITPFISAQSSFDSTEFITDRVYAKAKDGTQIPIFLFYKKGLKLDGNNPLVIISNGCSGKALRYPFSAFRIPFVESGGIFASIHVRGGTEMGEEWHEAGMGMNKHVSISDLKEGIEHLFAQKYSSPGNVVAASDDAGTAVLMGVVNQNPEWFKAIVARNGMFDLLNFERYNNAAMWRKDFGSVTDRQEFLNLLSLSPIHNLKEGGNYPAFFLECDLSHRSVSPIHTFKMAATLQDKIGKTTPIIVRINQEAIGNNKMQEVYDWTDRWSFFMHHLNMHPSRINL